jgi:hypothetical protein
MEAFITSASASIAAHGPNLLQAHSSKKKKPNQKV